MEIVIGGENLGVWQAVDDTREVVAYANDHPGHFHLRHLADPDTDVVVTFDRKIVVGALEQWHPIPEGLEMMAHGPDSPSSLWVRPRQ